MEQTAPNRAYRAIPIHDDIRALHSSEDTPERQSDPAQQREQCNQQLGANLDVHGQSILMAEFAHNLEDGPRWSLN